MNNQITPITRCTMTVIEAATYLGVSKDIIYTLCKQRQIDHIRIGKRILFKQEHLDKYLNNTMIIATNENYAV